MDDDAPLVFDSGGLEKIPQPGRCAVWGSCAFLWGDISSGSGSPVRLDRILPNILLLIVFFVWMCMQ